MGKLEGKVVVITGGASGIGKEGAQLFAENGACVVIADIDSERGHQLAQELGTSAGFIRTDVNDLSQMQAALAYGVRKFGHLDCLWNDVSIIPNTPLSIEKISVESFDRVMSTILQGVFVGIKCAAPIMKQQGSGSIINTASIAGIQAGFEPHLYSAAKAAIIHLTRSVAMELGESGVRVNCICPSGIVTPLLGKVCGLSLEESEQKMDRLKKYLGRLNPLKQACLPEDVAEAALWLASDDSGFVNGHALVIDGGVTSGRPWSKALKAAPGLRWALELDVE